MNPPEDKMERREVMKALAVTQGGLLQIGVAHAFAAAYAPKFFSARELEMTAALAELIIPQTDTPGARAAKAHEHIDLVLSEESEPVQRAFREGLAALDRQSRERYGKGFLELRGEEQTAMLAAAAQSTQDRSHAFFLDLRRRVVFAYYTSEIGLRQELQYKGKQAMGHWDGCPHPGHHGDSE